jgi:23S rRNA (guanosine2251-2'-O)-methyltransferase
MNAEFIFGVHPVHEWLESSPDRFIEVLVGAESSVRVLDCVKLAKAAGIPVKRVSNTELRRLSGGRNPKGVAAFVHPFRYGDLEDVLSAVDSPLLLVVDGVTDPGNLGALIRSASFFGVDAVIVPGDRSAPINPVVERSAAGAVARMPICRANSLVRTLEELKSRDVRIVASVVGTHPAPADVNLSGAVALVVGSEGRGVRPSVRRLATEKTTLPASRTNSLNVSAFTAVLLYEATQQRQIANSST